MDLCSNILSKPHFKNGANEESLKQLYNFINIFEISLITRKLICQKYLYNYTNVMIQNGWKILFIHFTKDTMNIKSIQ